MKDNLIRILLVDDHQVVRKGIKALIETNVNINVVGEASSAEEAFELIQSKNPNMIISDMSLPGMSGIQLTLKVKENFPEIGVLILSMHNDDEYILDALNAGAMGYLTKDSPTEEITSAIANISAGKMYYSNSLASILATEFVRKNKKVDSLESIGITERELDVLVLIVEGLSNKEIADKISVSKRTVDNHRFNLMRKLGAKNTADVVRLSFLKGLISIK